MQKKSEYIFFFNPRIVFGTHFGQFKKSTSSFWLHATVKRKPGMKYLQKLAAVAAFGRHRGHPLDAKVMSGKARLAEESWAYLVLKVWTHRKSPSCEKLLVTQGIEESSFRKSLFCDSKSLLNIWDKEETSKHMWPKLSSIYEHSSYLFKSKF